MYLLWNKKIAWQKKGLLLCDFKMCKNLQKDEKNKSKYKLSSGLKHPIMLYFIHALQSNKIHWLINWLIDWLVFNTNISAISLREQILLLTK